MGAAGRPDGAILIPLRCLGKGFAGPPAPCSKAAGVLWVPQQGSSGSGPGSDLGTETWSLEGMSVILGSGDKSLVWQS